MNVRSNSISTKNERNKRESVRNRLRNLNSKRKGRPYQKQINKKRKVTMRIKIQILLKIWTKKRRITSK